MGVAEIANFAQIYRHPYIMTNTSYLIERHPLKPFLPDGAQVLMLGSFPPPHTRWSMEFYYPNFINDMWRICGLVFFGDRDYFVAEGQRRFDRNRVAAFCEHHGIALYDTATAVKRLRENASDKYLEVVEPTDVAALLRRIPDCRAVVVTGEKAAETVLLSLNDPARAHSATNGRARTHSATNGHARVIPAIGESVEFEFEGRRIKLWRMPSSSRAYPLALDKKAEFYRRMFSDAGVLRI